MNTNNYIVVIEDAYTAKVLKQGTKVECAKFIKENPEICGAEAFIQESDYVYIPE